MALHDLIIRDPDICGSEPVFRGTRVPLRTVLASLADGDSVEQIVNSFPTLTEEQIRWAIRYAAATALRGHAEVEHEPKILLDESADRAAQKRIYELLSQSFESGESDVAERHSEHQP